MSSAAETTDETSPDPTTAIDTLLTTPYRGPGDEPNLIEAITRFEDPLLVQLFKPLLDRLHAGDGPPPTVLHREISELRDRMALPVSRFGLHQECLLLPENSGTLAVLGEPGLGKTFLWRAVRRSLGRMKSPVLMVYHKSPQSEAIPYSLYGNLLNQLLYPLSRHDRETTIHSILDRTGQYQSVRPLVLSILGEPLSHDEGPSSRTTDPATLALVVVDFLKARMELSEMHHAIVVVDDLQWVDDASLVVLQELYTRPRPTALLLLGRPEARSRLPDTGRLPLHTLNPLSRDEATSLIQSLVSRDPGLLDDPRLSRWILERSQGNPLAIVEIMRSTRRTRHLSTEVFRSPELIIPAVMEGISSSAWMLAMRMALLLPPVPIASLHRMPGFSRASFSQCVNELLEAGTIEWETPDEVVMFHHDLIEEYVRSNALEDADAVADALGVLQDAAIAGDTRAGYSVARMLCRNSAVLPQAVSITLLRGAARRALELLVASDALAFARQALELAGQRDVELQTIAHEAAFLMDDGEAMSHHFRWIRAEGTLIEVNRARSLWVTRAYGKLWIRGALRIGWLILQELEAVPPGSIEDATYRARQNKAARRFLRFRHPPLLRRKLERTPLATDPRTALTAATAGRVLLPMMTIYPDELAILAHIILNDSVTRGLHPYSGFGFICWSIVSAIQGDPVRKRMVLGTSARQIAAAGRAGPNGEIAYHSTVTYATLLASHWQLKAEDVEAQSYEHYRRGLELGNYEAASHAIHVALTHSLFLRGHPLAELFVMIDERRREVEQLGMTRVSRAMAKFQQAVECLLGRTENPLVLTGSICTEEEEWRRITRAEDNLAIAGFRLLKGMLAIFEDRKEEAFETLTLWFEASRYLAALTSLSAVWFYQGLLAASLGNLAVLEDCLRFLRRLEWTPDNHHRYLALAAARSEIHGNHARSDRILTSAISEALARGFYNEAALLAERHGQSLYQRDRVGKALERLILARSLYQMWGASGPVRRIDARMEALAPPHSVVEAYSRKTERELRSTQRRAEMLFEAIPEGLMLLNRFAGILFHNSAAERFFSQDSDQVSVLDTGIRSRILPLVATAAETLKIQTTEFQWEGRILTVEITPAPQEAGERILVAVISDVTRQRDHERTMILSDRMASLGMLAATVAHEVGNPNHIIHLNAQSLKIMLEGSERQDLTEAVESIMVGTERITEVVKEVTEYGKTGRSDDFVLVDPREICRRVLRFSRLLAQRYTTAIVFQEPPEKKNVPLVSAIAGQLEQALINLIRNACEALPDRSARLRLRLRVTAAGVEISVANQGAAFDPGEITPFHSGHPEDGGVGLGLPIVQTIVERHGGTLRFTSEEEYPTVVAITLPQTSPDSDAADWKTPGERDQPPRPPRPGSRDDDGPLPSAGL